MDPPAQEPTDPPVVVHVGSVSASGYRVVFEDLATSRAVAFALVDLRGTPG